jgi:demethylmenaquinone methyltransferase/2-methoxy-6-polyprenyl-1,4-benzoquinol methylase
MRSNSPSDTFQLVAIAFGLRNITDTDAGLSEIVRVTRPGGRIAILEFSHPRHWLLGRIYRWYFRYLLPLIGQIICRNRESAYRYLPESVLRFPDHEELAAKLRSHGLAEVRYEPFTFGIATLYAGVKPATPPGTPGEPATSVAGLAHYPATYVTGSPK